MLALRTALESQLVQLGIEPGEFHGVSMMLRENFLVGQKLSWAGAQALWFAEPNEAKLYDDRGQVIARLSPLPLVADEDLELVSDQAVTHTLPFPGSTETGETESETIRKVA